MQIDMSQMKKGSKIVWEGDPCVIAEYQFVKPGKGTALYKCKVKNMVTGAQWAKTWRSGDKVEKADLEEKKMQYLLLSSLLKRIKFLRFLDPPVVVPLWPLKILLKRQILSLSPARLPKQLLIRWQSMFSRHLRTTALPYG